MLGVYSLRYRLLGGLSKMFSCLSSGDVFRLLARVEVMVFF